MTEPTKRLSLSQILEKLLAERGRAGGERSSVTISRNARGLAQFEVTVRTGDHEAVRTAADAHRVAVEIYDSMCATYPVDPAPAAAGEKGGAS